MQIITILLGTGDDGKPFMQAIASDGTDLHDAAEACRRAMIAFQNEAIEAEVQRRLAEALAEVDGE